MAKVTFPSKDHGKAVFIGGRYNLIVTLAADRSIAVPPVLMSSN